MSQFTFISKPTPQVKVQVMQYLKYQVSQHPEGITMREILDIAVAEGLTINQDSAAVLITRIKNSGLIGYNKGNRRYFMNKT